MCIRAGLIDNGPASTASAIGLKYTRATVAALAEKLIANGHASTASAVAALAGQLIDNGPAYTASAIALKYTSQRLGGVGDQVDADGKTLNDGCLHTLVCYYKQ